MQRLRKPKTPTTKRLRPAAIMAACPLSPPQHFGMIEKNMSTMDDPWMVHEKNHHGPPVSSTQWSNGSSGFVHFSPDSRSQGRGRRKPYRQNRAKSPQMMLGYFSKPQGLWSPPKICRSLGIIQLLGLEKNIW